MLLIYAPCVRSLLLSSEATDRQTAGRTDGGNIFVTERSRESEHNLGSRAIRRG
jgi:hypothetical protein